MTFLASAVELTKGAASGWRDIDVSALVPVGTTGVLLWSIPGTDTYNCFRKKGSTDGELTFSTNVCQTYYTVGVDENRIFQHYYVNVGCKIYLLGYFGDEAVFLTNKVDVTPAAGSWQDVNIAATTGADTAVLAFINIKAAGYAALGLRKNGSTDNRITNVALGYCPFGIAACDESEIFEAYVTAGQTISLIGYMKSGVTMDTNGTDLGLTAAAWTDQAALAAGATGAVCEFINGTSYNLVMGVRKNGETIEQKEGCAFHQWAIVPCDESRIIEGYVSAATQDVYILGITTAGGAGGAGSVQLLHQSVLID